MKKLLLLLILFSFHTKADVFVDPYFGIMMSGTEEIDGTESSFSGFDMGSRFGWSNLGLFIGADYRYTNFSIDRGSDPKLTGNHWAAVLGYEFPFFLRIWGEYIFSSDLEDENERTYDDISGVSFGLGVKLLAFLSVNIEVMDYTAEGYSGNGSSNSDVNFSYYLISASVPLNF
jgi:hypothetical protein